MNTYQLLQDILNTPNEDGHYWYTQQSLSDSSGLLQSNLSKQLNKLVRNKIVKIELREYTKGKTGRYYCLLSKLDAKETAQQTALAQLRTAVEILSNDLRVTKKLSVIQYQSLLTKIKDINAVVKGEIQIAPEEQQESLFDRQYKKLRVMFNNLTDDQVRDFTTELISKGANRGAITEKYLTLNAEQT